MRVYFRAVSSISLVCMSVLMLVPYCYFFFFHVYRVITSFCLFLVALGLHCCAWAFSSCGEWGLFFTALHRLLIVVVSSCCETQALGHAGLSCGAWEFSSCGLWVLECGLWCGLSSCGARAQFLCVMWNLPRPGIQPVSPALTGRFPIHCTTRDFCQVLKVLKDCFQLFGAL